MKASDTMPPLATRVSVTLVGRGPPSSGSLPIGSLPCRGGCRAGPRSSGLHPQISHPFDRPSRCRHWQTTCPAAWITADLTPGQAHRARLDDECRACPAQPRNCRKSRISIKREVTTGLGGIGTMTTDHNTTTQHYPPVGDIHAPIRVLPEPLRPTPVRSNDEP